MNKRIFVERKVDFRIEQKEIQESIKNNFNIDLTSLRYFIIYDLFDIKESVLDRITDEVLSEKNKDIVLSELPKDYFVISYEPLPGQFDQRADSALQCMKLLLPTLKSTVRTGIALLYKEDLTLSQLEGIKKYFINKVESREKDLSEFTLVDSVIPDKVPILEGFTTYTKSTLKDIYEDYSLAMSFEDFSFIQDYFKDENRNPTETEIRVLDTYWSDHCRHTTFETKISSVDFSKTELSRKIEESFHAYMKDRNDLSRSEKPITLMDIATINAKKEFQNGHLDDLEISEEINAASIYISVDVDGIDEKWLLMFKNETHNHPTEIEPFGGASTCIGGAIRDPLSGRSYVYQAMRVTGAADILEKTSDTLIGKLPQSVISKEAARGYSSYGNQIGLATSFVEEIYHEGYKAKRMEIGAVVGAVKASSVRRESPKKGDLILLLGGRTGRDGIGGATGSSKGHTKESLELSGAEVQKGNAPEERKIQRLFRNPKVTRLIKKSNDFGAGGVSVAIGELADGLEIDLDRVPTKYKGINGTELAISESQERMAVVIEKDSESEFMRYCHEENIEVTRIAVVTDSNRLIMKWNNDTICDLSRDFINTSGVRQEVFIEVDSSLEKDMMNRVYKGDSIREQILDMLGDQNSSSQQGLVELFDPSIGRTTVLSPFGGKYKLTKTQSSVHKIPVGNKNTNTVSIMTYGFNPYISEKSPYHGAIYAVIDSMAKIVASGADYKGIRFTFQEYFERLEKDPLLWSKPLEALLGAYQTLSEFNLAAIGGKDSMSGSYQELKVPPTLVSFAVTTGSVDEIISPELKESGSYLYLIDYKKDSLLIPDFEQIKENFDAVTKEIRSKHIISAYALGFGGLSEALIKMSFGNKVGINIDTDYPLFDWNYGSLLVESRVEIEKEGFTLVGRTTSSKELLINDSLLSIEEALQANQERYLSIYPINHKVDPLQKIESKDPLAYTKERKAVDTVRVLIPVFPGTNCEYDCEKAFVKEGALVESFVFNNQNENAIKESIENLAKAIKRSHILMLAGGFSSGDEPDGSGKFIATVLKNEIIQKAIQEFLLEKNLILGICNGFQALIKSGLLPNCEVTSITEQSPTLFKNDINRHVARFADTKVSSISSPWLSSFNVGQVHTIAFSHGEGKFVVHEDIYQELLDHNQIAFQYVDESGQATSNPLFNPNGSQYAIEGIISRDGLILGKMGHSERFEQGLFQNISGNKEQNIFKNGVEFIRNGRVS